LGCVDWSMGSPPRGQVVAMNAFLIGSPLQLLNATEAKLHFGLTDNHLVILLGLGYAQERHMFEHLASRQEWETIRYVKLRANHVEFRSRLIGAYWSGKVTKYWNLYRQYMNRADFDAVARSMSAADNLFVGNYLRDCELYMRHLPNALPHKKLYLLDDGTDVIKVNNERRRQADTSGAAAGSLLAGSPWKRLKRRVLKRFVEWDVQEAGRITFFTVYDLDARHGDEVVKHDYRHLRNRVTHADHGDHVLFVGQCLVEDKYVERQVYFRYLREVRSYFEGRDVVYVPHPREWPETTSYISEHLGFRIEKPDVPIEWHLATVAKRPAILASFFCSALTNCVAIFGPLLNVKAFYIRGDDILKWSDFVEDVYRHFESKVSEHFELVK